MAGQVGTWISSRAAIALATVVAVAILAGGCGDDDDDPGPTSDEAARLIGRLPPDALVTGYVDLDAVREEIGVAADADPTDLDGTRDEDGVDEAALRFGSAASVLPEVAGVFQRFETSPVVEAIDYGRVRAGASTMLVVAEQGGISVLATEQPFSEIEEGLTAAGYRREGELLVADDPPIYPYAADLGDGIIALATDRATIERALSGEGEPAGAGAELTEVEGSVRTAAEIREESDTCIGAVGAGDRLEAGGGASGELRITVDGGASADRLRAASPGAGPAGELSFGEPEVDGDTLTVSYSVAPNDFPGPPPAYTLIGGEFLLSDFYDCG